MSLSSTARVSGTRGTLRPRWSSRVEQSKLIRARISGDTEETRVTSLSRRQGLLTAVSGIGGLLLIENAWAAYGDPANVLGKTTDTSGFIPYVGEGFALKIPSKWNPSPEREFEGVTVRYSDNADMSTHFIVISKKTEKKSISDYGSPDAFLKSTVRPLLGEQVFAGETASEGGFEPNSVTTAALLTQDTEEKNGKQYYNYEIFTRTADGDEGGRHQLFVASVGGGQLVILKVEIGDKRWFKGLQRTANELIESFSVV